MHTDNAENLMLCNLYIIKLVEHSQRVRACNHPLAARDRKLKKSTRVTQNVCERCKTECWRPQLVRAAETKSAEARGGEATQNYWGLAAWARLGAGGGFGRTDRHGDGLGNKLQTENDGGVMLLSSAL